jgi:hypothetical protein
LLSSKGRRGRGDEEEREEYGSRCVYADGKFSLSLLTTIWNRTSHLCELRHLHFRKVKVK